MTAIVPSLAGSWSGADGHLAAELVAPDGDVRDEQPDPRVDVPPKIRLLI
jgi:hypothetical protein